MTLPVLVWPHNILQTQRTSLELESTLVRVEKDHKDSAPNMCKVKVKYNCVPAVPYRNCNESWYHYW